MTRYQPLVKLRRNRELCKVISIEDLPYKPARQNIPCLVKSNRRGKSLTPPLPRESGNLVAGSRKSSKNGWHIASIAERRCVGVYSRSLEIRSMASVEALRNT